MLTLIGFAYGGCAYCGRLHILDIFGLCLECSWEDDE